MNWIDFMNYGIRLQELREENNLKLYDISNLLGLDKDTYGKFEREYTTIPIKHLITLCNYFQVSLDYIFNFTDTQQYKDVCTNINLELMGNRLKEFRKENKLTQIKLADFLNTDNSTISKYEKYRNLISTPFLYSICNEYHISADYLLGRVDYPKYL